MAKVDIESAYRLIPVHPQDRPLQAGDQIFVDPMLPFGLRSAPKIFNAVANGLHWHLQRSGIQHLYHYLDDFMMLGPPHSRQCQGHLDTLQYQCNRLGVPIAETEGPSSYLVFLGIEIDTVARELRLPADKLQKLQTLLQQWGTRRCAGCCTPHHCQGAATHPVGWNSLGSGMAKPPGGVPLR